MRRLWKLPVCLAVVLLVSGCAQTGMFTAANLTSVELSDSNYRVVATDVAGSAQAGYLLGVRPASAPMRESPFSRRS